MSSIRRVLICDNLSTLIKENKEFTVTELLYSIYRKKHFGDSTPYEATDEKVSEILENLIEEYKKTKE